MQLLRTTLTYAALGAALIACDDDVMTPQSTTFEVRIENVTQPVPIFESGVFNTPAGSGAPGPLMPGMVYEVTFGAAPGQSLHFATMFVQSNDFFYAPDESGIALYDQGGAALSGDVTDQVLLWDAGTEINQEPGAGADQAPNQAGPNTGAADPNSLVRLAPDDFGNLPDVDDVVEVSVDYLGGGRFRLRITNVSNGATLNSSAGASAVLLAPGVFAVSAENGVLFESGAAEPGQGLEALAEDGVPGALGVALDSETGLVGPIAPGVYAVHENPGALFTSFESASAGIEAMAEDGDPSILAQEVASEIEASGVFNTPEGAGAPGPAFPGSAYVFQVTAEPGDRLSFATMLVQSNDLFFGPSDAGIALFTGTTPIDADVTGMVFLWDAGTEVNQFPGAGPDQAPRQAGPDTGADEDGLIRQVNDQWTYPDVGDMVRVTITPVG